MTDLKTTSTGLVAALSVIGVYFHLVLLDTVWVAIGAVAVALFGLFSKDKPPST